MRGCRRVSIGTISGYRRSSVRPLAVAGVEPYATRLKAKPDELIQMYLPEEIHVVVAGGETQGAWKMFGGSLRKNATVSVDAWR